MKTENTEDVVRVTDEESGRTLTAWVRRVGPDVVVAVGGGDRPHVGCVVLAVPEPRRSAPTISLLTVPQHKEEPIARAVADAVCRCSDTVTVVTAGVHEDGIDRSGIETYLRLGVELGEAAAVALGEAK